MRYAFTYFHALQEKQPLSGLLSKRIAVGGNITEEVGSKDRTCHLLGGSSELVKSKWQMIAYDRAAFNISPWARRRNPPPLGGILGTYIVLKHSLRVFQIRLFALLKWRRLAVPPHSLCEAKKKKPQGTHVVVFESYT